MTKQEKQFVTKVTKQVTKVVNGKVTLDRVAFRNLPENVRIAYTHLITK